MPLPPRRIAAVPPPPPPPKEEDGGDGATEPFFRPPPFPHSWRRGTDLLAQSCSLRNTLAHLSGFKTGVGPDRSAPWGGVGGPCCQWPCVAHPCGAWELLMLLYQMWDRKQQGGQDNQPSSSFSSPPHSPAGTASHAATFFLSPPPPPCCCSPVFLRPHFPFLWPILVAKPPSEPWRCQKLTGDSCGEAQQPCGRVEVRANGQSCPPSSVPKRMSKSSFKRLLIKYATGVESNPHTQTQCVRYGERDASKSAFYPRLPTFSSAFVISCLEQLLSVQIFRQ